MEELKIANHKDVMDIKGNIIALTAVLSELVNTTIVNDRDRDRFLDELRASIRFNFTELGTKPVTPEDVSLVERGIDTVFDNIRPSRDLPSTP